MLFKNLHEKKEISEISTLDYSILNNLEKE